MVTFSSFCEPISTRTCVRFTVMKPGSSNVSSHVPGAIERRMYDSFGVRDRGLHPHDVFALERYRHTRYDSARTVADRSDDTARDRLCAGRTPLAHANTCRHDQPNQERPSGPPDRIMVTSRQQIPYQGAVSTIDLLNISLFHTPNNCEGNLEPQVRLRDMMRRGARRLGNRESSRLGYFACRVRHAASSFEYVCQKLRMAGRGHPRFRMVSQAGPRPLFSPSNVARIKKRLGEEQLPGAKFRLKLHDATEVAERRVTLPNVLQEFRKIERSPIRSLMLFHSVS